MKYVSHYECTLCHTTYDPSKDLFTCPKCGEKGILDIVYDYNRMKQEVNKEYFLQCKEQTMLRYTPLMSIHKPNYETLKVGNTPLYHSTRLGKMLGMDSLYIKDEGVNPTASLKDRASLVARIKTI